MKRPGGVVLLEMTRPDEALSTGMNFGGCGLILPFFWFLGLALGAWWLLKYLWNRILWSRFEALVSRSPIACYSPSLSRPWEHLPVVSSPGFAIDHLWTLATGVPPHEAAGAAQERSERFQELFFHRLLASQRADLALISLNGTPALCRSYHFDGGLTYAFYYLQISFSGSRTEWAIRGAFRDLYRWEKAGEARSLRYFENDMVVPFFNELAQLAFLDTVGLGLETSGGVQPSAAQTAGTSQEKNANASAPQPETKPSANIPNAQEARTRAEGEGFRKRW